MNLKKKNQSSEDIWNKAYQISLLKGHEDIAEVKNDSNDQKISGIQEIHQFCRKTRLGHPLYKIIETVDYSNNKLFTVKCVVNNISDISQGKRKKQAKHVASNILLNKLQQLIANGKLVVKKSVDEEMEVDLEEGEIVDEEVINEAEEGEINDDNDDDDNSFEFDTDLQSIVGDSRRYKIINFYIERGDKKKQKNKQNDNENNKISSDNNFINNNLKKSDGSNNADKNFNNKNYSCSDNKSEILKSPVETLIELCKEYNLPVPDFIVNKHKGLTSNIYTCLCSILQLNVKVSGLNIDAVKLKASIIMIQKINTHSKILKETNCEVTLKQEDKTEDLEEGEILENDTTDIIKNNKTGNNNNNTNNNFNNKRKNYFNTTSITDGNKNYNKRQKFDDKVTITNSSSNSNNNNINNNNHNNHNNYNNRNVTGNNDEEYMKELHNYCLKLHIPFPIYNMIGQKSSSNKTIFTFKCSVLRLTRVASGLSKRQAKHRAARLLLNSLINKYENEKNKTKLAEEVEKEDLLEEGEINNENHKEIKEAYLQKRKNGGSELLSKQQKETILMNDIIDRHNVIKNFKPYTNSFTLKKLKDLEDSYIKNNATPLLNQISKEIQVQHNFNEMESKTAKIVSVGFKVNSEAGNHSWSMFGVGHTAKEATKNATINFLHFFKQMVF